MLIEMRRTIIDHKVYWVRDERGKAHLYHDPIAAQAFEDSVMRILKEKEKGTHVDVHA